MKQVNYGLYKELPGMSFDQAVEKVTQVLNREGFGILTQIDVKETMKKKLNIDYKPYVILGACNPQLAYQALNADDTIGLLLPCNVAVAETGKGSEVTILRPDAMFTLVDNPDVRSIAREAENRLRRVYENL